MTPRILDEWRNEWRLKRGAVSFVESLVAEPDADDVAWLAALATSGDEDRARWELRYARRALGLLVAQRDALDDRTGSAVARELANALLHDPNVAAGRVKIAERQFNDRLAAYREVLTTRSPTEGTGARLGRTLLHLAGMAGVADDAHVARAGDTLVRLLGGANESLRKAFGTASLPEDVPPSTVNRDG